jgi:hypothetical protein
MRLLGAEFLKTQKAIIMLLPDNIHPDNSIYYNGAFVIESLKKETSYKIFDLFQEVKTNVIFSIHTLLRLVVFIRSSKI